MIHQPLQARGQASDIEITAREIMKLKEELYKIIAHHSGQEYQKVWEDSDRDYWMIADEAKAYGMIDEVLERKTDDPMADREINCSFCGRKKSEVDILIAGVTGHICDHCIEQADAIVKEERHQGEEAGFDPGVQSMSRPTSSGSSMSTSSARSWPSEP